MFESFGFETLTAPRAALYLALALGGCFGFLAQRTRFCFRRALIGEDRRAAMGLWLMALAVAVIGTQGAVAAGVISFEGHRFLSPDLPLGAIVFGGLIFGAGMVLARGCPARLTVLAASGNLRAWMVLLVFAIAAHATLKGVLSPLSSALSGLTLPVGQGASLAWLPGGAMLWSVVFAILALGAALRSGNRLRDLLGAGLLGALVPLGWVGTGFVLFDDFDPVALQSLSFASPWTESLFFIIASSAVPAGFGAGLIGGTILGGFMSALIGREFALMSFSTPRQMVHYSFGGVLMGVGAVMAGGCTIGAGLSGLPAFSLSALLTLVAITIGALATNAAMQGERSPGDLSGMLTRS